MQLITVPGIREASSEGTDSTDSQQVKSDERYSINIIPDLLKEEFD